MGDALDPDFMKNCPTWLEFVVLDIMKSDNQELMNCTGHIRSCAQSLC